MTSNGQGRDGVAPDSLRRAHISIDTEALRHNLQRVRDFAPSSQIMAVIKANAYGHGLVESARALESADMFGVAMPGEAFRLRDAGITKPLVVIHGFDSTDELAEFSLQRIDAVIHRPGQVEMLLEASLDLPLRVWLKLDSGMHRLGLTADQLQSAWQRLSVSPHVDGISLMTHFANADQVDNELNNSQLEGLLKANNNIGAKLSAANSAAVISIAASHCDIVRPGIMLYGASPFADRTAADLGLKPAMQFESRVIAVKTVAAGESIGYGSTWRCQHDTRVAIIAAGYADGYPRHAPSGTPVWLNGQRCALLGRVSMDSITVAIADRDINVGDRAVLWGRELAVDEVARSADTIAYELLCHAGSICNR